MAFPAVQTADTKTGTVTSNSTAWTLTYPTNIAAGDLLLALVAVDGGVTGDTWPLGWEEYRWSGGGPVSLFAAAKVADGTETGDFTFTISASEQGAWRIYRITGWYGSGLPPQQLVSADINGDGLAARAGIAGASIGPSHGQLNPANWAIEDTLWIGAVAIDTSRTISGFPSALPDLQTADVSGGSNGATLGVGMANAAVTTGPSSTPGVWTFSAADDSVNTTIGIRPGSSVPTVTGQCTMAGAATMTPTGVMVYDGNATIAGAATVAPAGRLIAGGQCTMAGAATVSPTGTLGALLLGQATMAGVATMTPTGQAIVVGQVTMVGGATVSPTGFRLPGGAVTMAGTGAVTPTGRLLPGGAITMAGAGALSGTGSYWLTGQTTIAGIGILTGTGMVLIGGAATMAGTGTESATGALVTAGQVTMVGTGAMTGVAASEVVPPGLIVGWPSSAGTIPAGWTRLTAMDSLHPKGAASGYGVIGGNLTHGHNAASHTHAMGHSHATARSGNASAATTQMSFTTADGAAPQHQHDVGLLASATATAAQTAASDAGATTPNSVEVIWIVASGSTTIPVGAVCWANLTAAPTGWTTYANGNARMYVGALGGGNGGALINDAHTHTNPHAHPGTGTHNHSFQTFPTDAAAVSQPGANQSAAAVAHSHSGNSGTQTTQPGSDSTASGGPSTGAWFPAHTKLLAVQKSSGSGIPLGIIAFMAAAGVPNGWLACNGSNGTPNLNGSSFPYVVGTTTGASVGTTAAATQHSHTLSHSHTVPTHTHGGTLPATVSTVVQDLGTTGAASPTHTHSITSGAASGTTDPATQTLDLTSVEPANYTVNFLQKTAEPQFGQATIAGQGALVATGRFVQAAQATMAGAGAMAPTGSYLRTGQVTMQGQGAVSATGTNTGAQPGQCTIAGVGTMTPTGRLLPGGRATMAGQGALSASAAVFLLGFVTFHGQGALIAHGSRTRIPEPRMLRVDVYDRAGARVGYGPLVGALDAEVAQDLDQLGSFRVRFPATLEGLEFAQPRYYAWIYREGEGLVFRGLIEAVETHERDGGSVTELRGRSILAGMADRKMSGQEWEGTSLATAAATLVAGTGVAVGTLGAGAPITWRVDGMSRWQAAVKLAEQLGYHVREDTLAGAGGEIDIDALGTPVAFQLRNVEVITPELQDNRDIGLVTEVDAKIDATGIVNKIYALGAGEGNSQLHLGYSNRTTPYAIQSEVQADGRTAYYVQDAASVAAYGTVEAVRSVKEAIPLGNSDAGFTAMGNALYDVTVDYMSKVKDPVATYTSKAVGLRLLTSAGAYRFQIGDKLRLTYRGLAHRPGGSTTYLDVDEDLWLMGYRRSFRADGSDDWQLKLQTHDRAPTDAPAQISNAIADFYSIKVSQKPYTYMAYHGPFRQSVDASNPLDFVVDYDANVFLVHAVKLRFRIRPLRSNTTTATSSSATTSSGGSSHSHSINADTTSASSTHQHTLPGATIGSPTGTQTNVAGGDVTSQGPSTASTGLQSAQPPSNHDHSMQSHTHYPGSAYLLPSAVHGHSGGTSTSDAGGSHSHDVSGSTSSAESGHTHTIAGHTHGLVYGIFQGTNPSGVSVTIQINGVDRTGALGGPWTGNTTVDITQYMVTASGQPQRIDNAIQLGANQLLDLEVTCRSLASATSLLPV